MATRTLLTPDQLEEARKTLRAPVSKPKGQVHHDHKLTTPLDFSSWLSLLIENRFGELKRWEEAGPIAIGSWGRGELCPGSDLDILFCGSESAVRNVLGQVQDWGLKIRSRVPDDPQNWTVGVDILESNALFNAKALTPEGAEKLKDQRQTILKKSKSFRRQLLRAISTERRERNRRYDSITNFLEPNLKFGAGGLRDLEQALMLAHWFPERFADEKHSLSVLEYYKSFLLLLRQKLHLSGSFDILTAQDQRDIFQWLGFDEHLEFMAEVQKALSRVSFHGDWVSERCGLSLKDFGAVNQWEPKSWQDCFKGLKKNPNLQNQLIVRKNLYESQSFRKEKLDKKSKGQLVKKIFDIKQDREVTAACFRSQLVSHLIPNFTKVIGLVQHDQYHRYSVDAHLLQAVKQVQRVYEHPNILGKLQVFTEKLTLKDWNILRMTALYHDMAKGQGGRHEHKGKELVLKDLKAFDFPRDVIDEVAWLVENHLILSAAAFRKNPHSPKTWEALYSRGCRGQKLYRLAIFTAIDIIATNPEAWNSWKESLLVELVDVMRNPRQESYFDFSQRLKRQGLEVPSEFLKDLELSLVEALPEKIFMSDFQAILSGDALEPLVVRGKKNRVWVRFHHPENQPGLLLDFTQRLTSLGCNIREASIHTHPEMGVYDWFRVSTTKSIGVLKKQLLHNTSPLMPTHLVFSKISLVQQDEEEWVFSFRAKDKKGLLLQAIQILYEMKLEIMWAKVHTWGRQIDDIFGVLPKKADSPEQIL
ncbi:MAG: HD domain-containing protein, partial [Pseudomonadota bacterium]